jgi:hypothetical protein
MSDNSVHVGKIEIFPNRMLGFGSMGTIVYEG